MSATLVEDSLDERGAAVLDVFAAELTGHRTTKDCLQVPYTTELPEDLTRRIATYRFTLVSDRDGDSFW